MNASRAWFVVNRRAWLIAPAATSSYRTSPGRIGKPAASALVKFRVGARSRSGPQGHDQGHDQRRGGDDPGTSESGAFHARIVHAGGSSGNASDVPPSRHLG